MKKIIKLAILSTMLLSGVVVSTNYNSVEKYDENGLVETALDLNNRNGVSVKDAKIGSSDKVKVSKTYAQLGQDNGTLFLRYITAVSGPIESITYTRSSERLAEKVIDVNVLYKGVEANGSTLYYDGNGLVTTESEATNDYYFACYTIKFSTDTYKSEDITAYITVNGENSESVVSEKQEVSVYQLVDLQPVQYIYTEAELRRLTSSIASGVNYKDKVVKLMKDLDLGEINSSVLEVSRNEFTLDLNGHHISATTKSAGVALVDVTNNGKFTVVDSSSEANGSISMEYQGAIGAWPGNYTVAVRNTGGTFVLESGNIVNTSPAGVVASAIDNQNYGSSVNKVIINGGTVNGGVRYGIRMFCNSETTDNYVEINGGKFIAKLGVYMQSPDGKNFHGLGKLVVNGGDLSSCTSKIYLQNQNVCSLDNCVNYNHKVYLNDENYSSDDVVYNSEVDRTHSLVKVAAAVNDEASLVAAISEGDNVVLTEDVELSNNSQFIIANNQDLTINLKDNDMSVVAEVDNTNALFKVNDGASLRLVGTGTITYEAVNADTNEIPGYASNAISNYGNLVVDGVTIENKTVNGSATYCIDNYNNASLTINSGRFVDAGVAIRVFANSSTNNNVTINGGTFDAKYGMWVQLPGEDSALAPVVNVTVNDGEFINGQYSIYVYSFGNSHDNVSVTLNGGSFDGYVYVDIYGTGTAKSTYNGGTFASGYGFYSYVNGWIHY